MATSATTREHRPARLAAEPASSRRSSPASLLAIVGFAGKLTERTINTYTKAHHITFPNIEYVLWAILFGILIANTIGVARIFRPGVATYEFSSKAGIILLGARFVLGDVLKLGGISLILVFIAITLSIAFMTWLGRAFKLPTHNPARRRFLHLRSLRNHRHPGRHRRRRRRLRHRHRRHPRTRSHLSVCLPRHRPRAPHVRSRLRPLGRSSRRQHRRSHCRRSPLLRRRRQIRRPGQDLPQRPHRLRRSRLRHPVGAPRPRQRRHRAAARKQSRLPLEGLPQVCPRLPLHLSPHATLGASSNPTLAALGFNKSQLLALET